MFDPLNYSRKSNRPRKYVKTSFKAKEVLIKKLRHENYRLEIQIEQLKTKKEEA